MTAITSLEHANAVEANGANLPHDPQPAPQLAQQLPRTNGIRIYNSNRSGDNGGGGRNSNVREAPYCSDVNKSSKVADVPENVKRLKINHGSEFVEKIDENSTSYVSEQGEMTPDSKDGRQNYESDGALESSDNDGAESVTTRTVSSDRTHGDQEDLDWEELQDYPHEDWTLVNVTRRLSHTIDKSSSSSLVLLGAVERLSERASTDSDVSTTLSGYDNALEELNNERSKRKEGEKAIDNLLSRMSEMEREVSYLRAIHQYNLPLAVQIGGIHEHQTARLQKEHADLKRENQELKYYNSQYGETLRQVYQERQHLMETIYADSTKFEAFQRQVVFEKHELFKQVRQYKEEAAKYQLLLGNATSVRWGDNDSNNSVQLRKDITKLQNMLTEFMLQNSKKGVVLNEDAVLGLLKRYDCKSDVSAKPIFAAALQRRTIEMVLEKAREFLDESLNASLNGTSTDDTRNLEARINSSATLLVEQLNEFSRTREGSDNVTNVTPIKVRQQVYAVLGNRSFYTTDRHPLISRICEELLSELDQYRSITSPLRLENVKAMAPELVHDLVRMFQFRFQAQEPPAEVFWYDSGTPTSKSTMQGPEMDDDEDEDEDDEDGGQEKVKVVEICSFPLIGVDLNDPTKRQIISPARVHSRSAPKLSGETPKLSGETREKSRNQLSTIISGLVSFGSKS